MDHRANRVLVLREAINETVNDGSVGELNFGPGRVDDELLSQVASDVVGPREQVFAESMNVVEGDAVRCRAGWIDRGALFEAELGLAEQFADVIDVAIGPIVLAILTNGVKGLEGEPGWIDLAVAGGAGCRVAVLVE